MPKYKPRPKAATVDQEIELTRERSANASAFSPLRTAPDRDTAYGPLSDFSYFRDAAVVSLVNQQQQEAISRGIARIERVGDVVQDHYVHGGLADARARLDTVQQRVVTGAGGASAFSGSLPVFLAEAFATGQRARSVMPSVLPVEPLPSSGFVLETPRFSTSPTVAVQQESGAVSNTDFVADLVTSSICTVSGQSEVTQQVWDRSTGGVFDVAMARELGEATATALDAQILFGIGSAGQIRGLANVVGITDISKTNASPTAVTNLKALGDLCSQTSIAFGSPVEVLLLHPRRFMYIVSTLGYAPQWPAKPVIVPNLRSTLGGGTNADEAFALVASEQRLYLGTPQFHAFAQVLSNNLQVRYQAIQYAALLAGRKPAAIGRMTGTELQPPVW